MARRECATEEREGRQSLHDIVMQCGVMVAALDDCSICNKLKPTMDSREQRRSEISTRPKCARRTNGAMQSERMACVRAIACHFSRDCPVSFMATPATRYGTPNCLRFCRGRSTLMMMIICAEETSRQQ